jgi:hypothetical protein
MRWWSPRTATRQLRPLRRDAVPERNAPGRRVSHSVAPNLTGGRPCPSPSPQRVRSRCKGPGQRAFARRGPRAHRYRQTAAVGSCGRPSGTEAGSWLLRGAVADCEGDRDQVPDEATARTAYLACSSTRRGGGFSSLRDKHQIKNLVLWAPTAVNERQVARLPVWRRRPETATRLRPSHA